MSIESFTDPKMEEQNLDTMTSLVLHFPNKQDVSNLSWRKFNSISMPPIKAYVEQKGEPEHYEYKSKGIRVKKSCVNSTKKNRRGLNKYHGKSS